MNTDLMKQFLLCISLFLLTVFCHAQELRIVKDNINCTYGLKDQAGNWVIEPTYILIQLYNSGYFLAKDALGDGLLSPTGKQIIQCKYDQLNPIQPRSEIINEYSQKRYQYPSGKSIFFQAKTGDQEVILNSRGKQIVQLSPHDKVQFDGEAHILIYGNEPLTSTYVDTSGNVLINKISGAILPFGSNEFSLHGKGIERHSKVVQGDVQLITRKGEHPLSEQFERAIFGANNQICFEQDSKYGEMTTEGKMLIAPQYRRKTNLQSSQSVKYPWIIYDETGQEGVMEPDGTILLAPTYDEIRSTRRSYDKEKLWVVSSNGLKGIFSYGGETILPVSYDQITLVYDDLPSEEKMRTNFLVEKDGKFAYILPLNNTNPTTWYDDVEIVGETNFHQGESLAIRLIVKQNGKYGMLNLDGTVFSKCIYDLHTQLTANRHRHFFSKGMEVVEFNFSKNKVEPINWTASSATDKAIIFTNPPYFITAAISKNKMELTSLIIKNNYQEVFGNMMILNRPENADWEIINIATQEKIEIKYIADIKRFGTKRFLFTTRYREIGILDEDGNILVKPNNYWEFRQNNKSSHFWGRLKSNQWILIDEFGNQALSDTVEETFQVNSGNLLRTINDKSGLFDTKELKWKIEPKYPCLFKSVGDFYIVSEALNQKGIIRADGTILLPLTYQSIQLLTTNCKEDNDCKQGENVKIKWLARTGTTEIMVDQKGQTIKSSDRIRAFKEAILFADDDYIDPFNSVVRLEVDSVKSYTSIEEKTIQLEGFNLFPHHQTASVRNFPTLKYDQFASTLSGLSESELRIKRKELWSNSDFKSIILDSINADWSRMNTGCFDYHGSRYDSYYSTHPQEREVEVKSKKYYIDEFKRDCSCSQQNHSQITGYGHGDRFYRLKTKGARFATIAIGFHGSFDDRYMTMSQAPPPPPPAEHMNFVVKNGNAISIKLNDIFTSKSLLLEEFIVALKLRDDLQLDCSSLENMITLINGRFSLSKEGVYLYYPNYNSWHNEPIRFLIPIERLKLRSETKWIVPILENVTD